MNRPTGGGRDRLIGAAAAMTLTALLGLMAIDGRSFWIDEFGTWIITQHDTISEWWRSFLRYPDSDSQIPLYHLIMYYWSHVFGTSEQVLRLANLPWFAVALLAVGTTPLRLPLRLAWMAALSINAFDWFYLNEARPYMMVVSAAALMVSSAIEIVRAVDANSQIVELRSGIVRYAFGAMLLVGATVLGAFWIASTAIALFGYVALRGRLDIFGRALLSGWLPVTTAVFIAAACLSVSVASFLGGARAAQTGFSLSSIGYGIIETLGMAGIGPGRNDLRAGGAVNSLPEVVVMAGFACVAVLVVLISFLRLRMGHRLVVVVSIAIPMAALIVLSFALEWRVVGRHFAPLAVVMSLAYGAFVLAPVQRPLWHAPLLVLLLVGLTWSAYAIRFAPRHFKDDYAAAAAAARAALAEDKVVWWAADPRGATYYGLLPTAIGGSRLELQPQKAVRKLEGGGSRPDLVAYSKPDTYDRDGKLREVIETVGLQIIDRRQSFEIYSRR